MLDTTQQAICKDGTRLAFALHGSDANAARIVLVHSLAMDGSFWHPVAARLAREARVLVYDCRGHGASDKPSGPYSTRQFAGDLADLLDHIDWPSAFVAGASMGGCVSLAFAELFPERTSGLGLIDTTAWYGPDAPAQWEQRARKALQEGLKGLVEFQITRWFSDDFRARHPDVVRQCLDVFLANDTAAYAESCRMLGAADLRGALHRIACPATVIVGEEDYATPPAMAQAMHDGIRDSRLLILPKARHLTPLEMPARIASELGSLMKSRVRA